MYKVLYIFNIADAGENVKQTLRFSGKLCRTEPPRADEPVLCKKTLTNHIFYDIVDGRMEEPRSFFYAQIPNEGGQKRDPNIKNF